MLILEALILQVVISIPPIRTFQPYPSVKCPKGYALWWPAGNEFDNDKYAECVQWARTGKLADKGKKRKKQTLQPLPK